jgi:hypothetical protein
MFCVCGRGRRGEDGTLLRVCGHNFLFVKRASLFQPFLRNTTTKLLFCCLFGLKALRKPLLHSGTALLPASTSVRMTKRKAAEVYKARSRATFTSQIGGVQEGWSVRGEV